MHTDNIELHYQHHWGKPIGSHRLTTGPIQDLGPHFAVLVFPPRPARTMWTYATCGMSRVKEAGYGHGLELHLLSMDDNPLHVELLTAIAHYHVTGRPLGWGHTVNFGRPWYPGSKCSYGLLSLPYLDGPELEWCHTADGSVHCLWLVPITFEERELVRRANSPEPLEALMEEQQFNYVHPHRPSLV
jgi:hypothetical protein